MADKFPLEKILTVSAREYCESKDNSLTDYKMIGVHADGYDIQAISEIFHNQASNAEVITDYQFIPVFNTPTQKIIASGTALIPHKQDKFD